MYRRQFVMGLLEVFIYFLCINFESSAAPVISNEVQAMTYLERYGYMNESNSSDNLITMNEMSRAISEFQRFAGITESGELDESTIKMMNTPRCGVKDDADHSQSISARTKRYALQGSKWPIRQISYRITKYPRRLQDRGIVDKEIEKAFKVWSDVSNINFVNNERAHVDLTHMDIRFEEGDHGDGQSFDGPGQTLAHAFFPLCGSDAHFDDQEQWTINENQGTNLYQVAAHEFGHSLGLFHSNVKSSVMAPFYTAYEPNKRLDEDDIMGIQALYGRPNTEPESTPRQSPRNPDRNGPDLCRNASIDAFTYIADGRAFAFKDHHYWGIGENGILEGYPRKISQDWDGLPGNIDAAFTWSNGKTYIFKGEVYYRFTNQQMDSGYPKPIHFEFKGIPSNLDAAFVWSGNGKIYFFKGSRYWRFESCREPSILSYYPLDVSGWRGIPNGIDAAIQWNNRKTYFFKGDIYYKFNDETAAVDIDSPPYPRQNSEFWFSCTQTSK